MARKIVITETDVWNEIDKFMQSPPMREDGEFDMLFFMNKYGLPRSTAKYKLLSLVRDGKMTTRKVKEGGVYKRVWRISPNSERL